MQALRLTLPALFILLQSGCASVDRSVAHTDPPADNANDAIAFAPADAEQDAVTFIDSHEGPAAGDLIPLATHIESDFWQQLRKGFSLPGTEQQAVQKQIDTYTKNPGQVETIFERGTPYLAYILREVEKRGQPHELVLLPFVESAYDPFAYSQGRAAGLWQFIPGTGKLYGLEQDWWYDGRRDVIASTEAALDYLDKLHDTFEGDWLLALAAYNSGSSTVRSAMRRNARAGKPTDFWHLKLPKETAAYVPRLLAISAIVRQPERYDIAFSQVDPEPAFDVVDTRGQLDIGIAAELADMDTDQLYQLNPGFNRWATHPDGPHRLAIPTDKADIFVQGLDELPEDKRPKWVRHAIKRGETLSHIAKRYDTTVAVLRSTNQLSGNRIRSGQYLLVPIAARDPSAYTLASAQRLAGSRFGSPIQYQVVAGDNLWSIARRHKVSISQISKWNRLDPGAAIKPGQKLALYTQDSASPGVKQVRTIRYTVRSGDSLYGISRKYNVAVSDLRRWNSLPEGKFLQPGQRLTLYIDITDLAQSS